MPWHKKTITFFKLIKIKMNRKTGIVNVYFPFFMMFLLIMNSCQKEDDKKEDEQIKLQQYLEQQGYTEYEPTTSGLIVVPLQETAGVSPELTDYVNIYFTASLIDGFVFGTSDKDVAVIHGIVRDDVLYGPAKFSIEDLGIAGLKEGLMKMRAGEKSRLIIPSSLAFGSSDLGAIPPYSTVIYDVELLDVISDPDEHEKGLLEAFLHENLIETDARTSSGLYYIEELSGAGDLPSDNQKITIHYRGSLLDGRVFDQSQSWDDRQHGIPMVLDLYNSAYYIPGFIEGVKKMRKGAKARIIIPWDIGFGANGEGKIPPYSTLVFDLEIADIQ
jgi:FKBP-type peptidyl-prolyl cis-trans isomerase FkpA